MAVAGGEAADVAGDAASDGNGAAAGDAAGAAGGSSGSGCGALAAATAFVVAFVAGCLGTRGDEGCVRDELCLGDRSARSALLGVCKPHAPVLLAGAAAGGAYAAL